MAWWPSGGASEDADGWPGVSPPKQPALRSPRKGPASCPVWPGNTTSSGLPYLTGERRASSLDGNFRWGPDTYPCLGALAAWWERTRGPRGLPASCDCLVTAETSLGLSDWSSEPLPLPQHFHFSVRK